jgi:hypothetical protein
MQSAAATDFSITTGGTERPATAYLFYPLNMIAPAIKASVPTWRAGGCLRPELATLRHVNGYIRQCEITECRQHMVAQAARNVYPTERRHMVRGYNITENGITRTVQGGAGGENALLFTPWYPDQELGPVLAQNDGLVRIPVSSAAEAREAQLFLFPNWDRIVQELDQLPAKLQDLREHLIARRAAVPAGSILYQVADACVRACDQAEAYGRTHVTRENAMYAEAQVKGWAWTYGVEAELYMEQLGLQRRDNLQQEQTNKIDRLADVLAQAFGSPQFQAAIPAQATRESLAPVIEKAVEMVEATTGPEIALPPVKVDDIVKFEGKVGQIVAINKKGEATIEAPDGTTFKAQVDKLER